MAGFTRGQIAEIYKMLLKRNLSQRYRGALLGMSWMLLHPAILSLVLYFVFFVLWKRSVKVPAPMLFILAGLLPWNLLTNGVVRMLVSVRSNAGLIRAVPCPRLLFPTVILNVALIDFAVSLLLLPPFYLFYHFSPSYELFALPAILLILLSAMAGLGYMLSVLNVFYRDVEFIIGVAFRLLFFLSPVFYDLSRIPVKYQGMYKLNPMATMILLFRWSFMGSDAVPFPGWEYVGLVVLESVVLFIVGLLIFRKYENTMVKLL